MGYTDFTPLLNTAELRKPPGNRRWQHRPPASLRSFQNEPKLLWATVEKLTNCRSHCRAGWHRPRDWQSRSTEHLRIFIEHFCGPMTRLPTPTVQIRQRSRKCAQSWWPRTSGGWSEVSPSSFSWSHTSPAADRVGNFLVRFLQHLAVFRPCSLIDHFRTLRSCLKRCLRARPATKFSIREVSLKSTV